MSIEPGQEPVSRPGPMAAVIAAAVVIGLAMMYFWPVIKVALNLD